jgi:hypothetical protein
MPTTRITKRISDLVSTQLPEHVTSDFPIFRTFIEKYYSYIEQDQEAQEILQNAFLYSDIDKTINSLLEVFSKQFTNDIPKNILADKKFFIKLASELYTRKGTEEAYRIFFRIFFNEEIDFFYPNTVLLKPSEGKWDIPRIMKVSAVAGSPFDLIGTKITGNISKANAIIDSVVSFTYGSNDIFELSIEQNSLEGNFVVGENIIGKKLVNAKSNLIITTAANIIPIIKSIDIFHEAAGYTVNEPIIFTSFYGEDAKGYISEVTEYGGIKKILLTNYGHDYNLKPNVSVALPSASFYGKYDNTSNISTLRLNNKHGLTIGSNVNVTFTDNIYNSLNNQTKKLTVSEIIDPNTFKSNISDFYISELDASDDYINVDSNLVTIDFTNQFLTNSKGNVSLVYTVEKFYTTPFSLKDNVIRLSVPIDHGLTVGDNVKITIKNIDANKYTGNLELISHSNVTMGFIKDHGLDINEKINVFYTSHFTNTTTGVYVLSSIYNNPNYYNNANISFNTYPHYFVTGQSVNVNFGMTLTNAIVGTFLLEGNSSSVFFNEGHNFKLNENVNVSFSNAKLMDDNNKIQLKGNANISFASNTLIGNDTEFTSNIFPGNIISVGRIQEFGVASVISNTLAYLTSNSEYSFILANIYQATSNLTGNSTITKVIQIPNSRRLNFYIDGRANAIGCVLISSNVSNVALNTFATGTVTNNGYPIYNFITVNLPNNFANANSRGIAIVRNSGTSNIIGNYANNITIASIPNSKTIIFNSKISSNIASFGGTANLTVSLNVPPAIVNYEGSSNFILGDQTYLSGDIFTYLNYTGTHYGVYTVPNSNTINLVSHQPNTRGKLHISFNKLANLQANIGAIGIGEGKWRDHSSILDETFKLQGRIDNNKKVYYQTFSYVIKSTKALSVWEKAVKKIIHPAGMEIFSEVIITTSQEKIKNVIAKANFYPVKITSPIDASVTSVRIDSLEYSVDNLRILS